MFTRQSDQVSEYMDHYLHFIKGEALSVFCCFFFLKKNKNIQQKLVFELNFFLSGSYQRSIL